MSLNQDRPLLANPDVVFREEDDGAFLFHPDTGELKCLNPMGSVIWHLCDGSHTLEEIERKIFEKYPEIPDETIREALINFIQRLVDIGYIGVLVPESGGKNSTK